MKVLSVAVVVGAVTALAGQVLEGQAAPAASDRDRAADVAAIQKLHQQDVAATMSRDPVALTEVWTVDAIRLSPGQPAEVGKQAIRESHERWSVRQGVKVLSYVPETKDLTVLDGWAVEWGYFTGSYVESPGGDVKQIRGTVLTVLKKLSDGSWKCFRRMGDTLIASTGQVVQGPAVSIRSNSGGAADLAGIEKAHQRDIAATVSRDPVALTDLWTDDAVRLTPGQPAEVGKQAIRERNERGVRTRAGLKVLSYIPETRDLTFLNAGWAVEWRTFSASIVESPGGEAKQIRGTVLGVWKKLPDASWKGFRGMGM
jgi:ketosteroid isomerase-like protein